MRPHPRQPGALRPTCAGRAAVAAGIALALVLALALARARGPGAVYETHVAVRVSQPPAARPVTRSRPAPDAAAVAVALAEVVESRGFAEEVAARLPSGRGGPATSEAVRRALRTAAGSDGLRVTVTTRDAAVTDALGAAVVMALQAQPLAPLALEVRRGPGP